MHEPSLSRPLAGALALLLVPALAAAQDWSATPRVAPASDEGAQALKGFTAAEGISLDLFAAEPMLANPVCLTISGAGDVYVGETFRHFQGVTDIRNHMDWLDDDLASRTVEDRRRMLQKHEGAHFADYGLATERVRLIRDTDGDGKADTAIVFADGFDDPVAGIGAGLLENHGDVYYTCIPDLWLLRDTDGDGKADEKRVLSTGYGVNVSLLGHDLHGLRIGPDGRLYFSSGDRGFHVVTPDGVVDSPKTGAVLRCNLDGSGLEIWARGLRNPQELAFDDYGDLFTGDNNSDGGDKARFVNVVEGGDSGWRYPYQWITAPLMRGPWNDEELWHPPHEGEAAYVLSPIANLADGPSGLTCYPGTGLAPDYAGHFFLCDFRGTPRYSGIHTFTVVRHGASYQLGPDEHFVWGTLATDCDFGPDGKLYFTDWVDGWNQTGKGRVYRAFDPVASVAPIVAETRALLAAGMAGRGLPELEGLLAHPDRRVRQEAELELAGRGAEGAGALARAARGGRTLFARLHGIWGLGVAGRRDPALLCDLFPLLSDQDPEVRAQAVRVVGDERYAPAADQVVRLLDDPEPRVRAFAAHAAGRLHAQGAIDGLVRIVEAAGIDDPNLRHAGVMGLLGCADDTQVLELADHGSPRARMAALLVLRRRSSPEIARFLVPSGAPGYDPDLVVEAARAVHDVPIPAALPALAALVSDPAIAGNALVRRVLNACFLLGRPADMAALADFALRPRAEVLHRTEALELLAEWAAPPPRDGVTNVWRPLPARDASGIPALVERVAQGGIADAPTGVADAFARLAATSGANAATPLLADWVADAARAGATRVAALQALGSLGALELATAVDVASADADGDLRAAALGELERLSPAAVLARIPRLLASGELAERRAAYRILGHQAGPQADTLLAGELEKLAADLVPAELALDLVQAAEGRAAPAIQKALADRAARRSRDPVLAPWLDALFGGDPTRGKQVFERTDLSCVRCHQAAEDGAPLVGPSLAGVGHRLSRLQMLESILQPNRVVKPGYEGTVLFLADGSTVAGRVLSEQADVVRIQSSDGKLHDVAAGEIDERRADLSAMPEDLGKGLSKSDARDLLAYLSSL